jgi:nucleoside-diphosphate-sugar epimerase
MDILVIGGNRFFGKKLCQRLVSGGHRLSILNRGSLPLGLDGVEDARDCR